MNLRGSIVRRASSLGSSLLAFAALVLVAGTANADVIVRGHEERVQVARLSSLIDLELGPSSDIERVTVDLADSDATISIRRKNGRERRAQIGLDETRSGDVERTIALFVGEVSRDEDVPIATPPSPNVTPMVPAAAPEAVPVVPRRSTASHSLFAGLDAHVFASGGAFFVGPLIGADAQIADRLSVAIRGRYLVAGADVALGSVNAKLASVGPSASVRLLGTDLLAVRAGAAFDVGWFHGSGEGTDARTTSALSIAPSVHADARWALSSRFLLTLEAHGGWLGPGVELRASNRPALAAHGVFVGTSLALGMAL